MSSKGNEQDVLDLVTQWAELERSNSADGLESLLVDDFLLVGPLGFILTKAQMLARYRPGALKQLSFEIQEPSVRLYSDAAVVVATQVQQTTYEGRDASGTFRITLVAVHRDDRWQFAGMHLSPVAGPR